MSNCQESSGVSPDATANDNELCRRKWPRTRQALLVARLDEELDKMPRAEWFDRALAVHVVHEHEQQRDALTKAHDAMFERIRERSR